MDELEQIDKRLILEFKDYLIYQFLEEHFQKQSQLRKDQFETFKAGIKIGSTKE